MLIEVAKRLQGKAPVPRKPVTQVYLSGPQQAIALDSSESLIRIGERLNVRGSKKVRDAVEREGSIDQESLEEVVKEQVGDLGLEIIDVCMDSNQVNTAQTLVAVVRAQSVDFPGAMCLDSFDVEALGQAIEAYPGRPIINSISMEEYAPGLDKVDAVLAVTKAHAPLYIALTTGPKGPAVTQAEKIDLAKQILDKAIQKHGQKPEQFLVDINAFPIGSESEEGMNFALESIRAIPGIKALYPGVKTTIGVGNLTNGLAKKPYMRKVLTSVFLAEARKAGLDAAIVNPHHYVPVESLDPVDRELGRKVVLERDMEAFAKLEEIAALKSGGPVKAKPKYEDFEPAQAICLKIKEGFKERSSGEVTVGPFVYPYQDKIVEDCAKVIQGGMEPLVLINDHLMVAMEELGAGFAQGEVSLPHLLKAADVMKQVMGFLEGYIKSRQGQSGAIQVKGKVVLGTVYQDVHSIGKDLTKTLMENYGYQVIDLGVQVPLQAFIDAAKEHGAKIIGCSALLVQTSNHMIALSKMLEEQGLAEEIDLLIGGAPVSFRHAAQVALAGGEDSVEMRPNVFYCASAMDGVNLLGQLSDPQRRGPLLAKNLERMELALDLGHRRAQAQAAQLESLSFRTVAPRAGAVDLGLCTGPRTFTVPLTRFKEKLNKTLLFTLNWKYGGKGSWEKKGVREAELLAQLDHWSQKAETQGWITPQGRFGLFPCRSLGNEVVIYQPDGKTEAARLSFNDIVGQGGQDKTNVAHYFNPQGLDWIGLLLATSGNKVEPALAELKGQDGESAWMLQGLSDRVAEDMASELNRLLEAQLEAKSSCRYSPGYPAMTKIELNRPIFELLAAQEIGVSLTEGFEFSPTGTTAAVVCFHPEAGYH